MGLGIGGVALDEVADLIYETCVLVHQAGGALDQLPAASGPHFPVADELLAVVRLPLRVRIVVAGMVILRVGRVVMGISQDNNRIPSFLGCQGLHGMQSVDKAQAYDACC